MIDRSGKRVSMRGYLRAVGIVTICGIASVSIRAQESKRCDSSCINSVKSLISDSRLANGQSGYFSSWSEKAAHRLGDRVTVGIIKVFRKSALKKPQSIKIILPVIREAFSYPELIVREEDRTPGVSLTFLRNLEDNVQDDSLKKEISELIRFIQQKTEH